MTLNANYPGAVRMPGRPKLEGPERGLDALVGLIIVVTELFIGMIAITALYEFGNAAFEANQYGGDAINAGFLIAIVGGGILFLVTTIVYLGRIIVGRRSWPAPLWGTILMTAAILVGYAVMAGAL